MEQWTNSHFREITEEYIHSERDRRLLIRRFCDNNTVEQLAEEFELSDSQIKRIILKHSSTIFGIMEKDEQK